MAIRAPDGAKKIKHYVLELQIMSSSFNTSGLSGLRLHIRNLEPLKRTASVSDICTCFTFRGFLGVELIQALATGV